MVIGPKTLNYISFVEARLSTPDGNSRFQRRTTLARDPSFSKLSPSTAVTSVSAGGWLGAAVGSTPPVCSILRAVASIDLRSVGKALPSSIGPPAAT